MTIEQKRRELFEAAYKNEIERHCKGAFSQAVFARAQASGDYILSAVQTAFCGFNAALDAVVIELPRLWISNNSSASEQAAVQTLNACKEAIESTGLGLKVKV